MSEICMRKFRPGDIAKVRKMFSEAFELDCYSKSKFVMRHLLSHYLCAYLARSDYAYVAENGLGVRGFILGETKEGRGRLIYTALRLWHAAFLPFSRGGRAYRHCRRMIYEVDGDLRRNAPPADAELVLFVVDKSSRGEGIGRHMLDGFRDALMASGAHTVFLFTDDYCDVDYYRKRGYTQIGMRGIQFRPGDESQFYLFTIPTELMGARMGDRK